MKALAYLRVSTEKQVETGVSLENQAERVRQYCGYRGFDLIDTIRDEGISGGVNKARDGFNKLLDRIEDGSVDVLVLYSLERLSRDMLTLLALERYLDAYDVELHTVDGAIDTSTPDGFMNFGMKAFLSEFERRQVKYRTKKNMEHLKESGRLVGAVPYGYVAVIERDVKRLVENPKEQQVIVEANECHEIGASLTEIARTLNNKGYRTRNGKPFTAQQVKRMLDGYQDKWNVRKGRMGKEIRQFITAIG